MQTTKGLTAQERKEYAFLTANLDHLDYEQGKRLGELRAIVIASRQSKATQGNLERKKSTLRKTRIKHVSKRQAAINRKYTELRKAFLEERPICGVEMCAALATDIHHRKRRGIHTLEVDSWLQCCRRHHQFIEENGRWAREKGYIL